MFAKRFFYSILILVAIMGFIYSVRATIAQVLYYSAKYGSARNYTDGIIWRAERIKNLYPQHYLAFTYAASSAYRESKNNSLREKEMKNIAREFCDLALESNPYKRQMRLLDARLIAENNPYAAVEKWKNYLEWAFWDPLNHKLMIEFYLKAGDIASAVESLEFTIGSPYYEQSKQMINETWKKERSSFIGR